MISGKKKHFKFKVFPENETFQFQNVFPENKTFQFKIIPENERFQTFPENEIFQI